MPKQIDQIVAGKEWKESVWELNRILAKIQQNLGNSSTTSTPTVVNQTVQNVTEVADETLHWVL